MEKRFICTVKKTNLEVYAASKEEARQKACRILETSEEIISILEVPEANHGG